MSLDAQDCCPGSDLVAQDAQDFRSGLDLVHQIGE